MKLSIVNSYTIVGIEARPISIEVHLSNGLPGLSIVGLPEAAVRESKDRVRSAILNAGFDYPARRITVNLAPADLPKHGAGFDLPIAIGILHASDQLKSNLLTSTAMIGELSLSGELRTITGVLPIAVKSSQDNKQLLLPDENKQELQVLENADYVCGKSLIEICGHLTGLQKLARPILRNKEFKENTCCLSDIKGQQQAKRVLEIAAAGRHSLLMSGPPGTGKSMLSTRLPTILPNLSFDQMLEVSSIYSVAQMSRTNIEQPPYRSPHHTASPTALVGGGSRPIPGEISLSHQGVLFLDELPEFPAKVLEVMRQPIETGEIWVSRTNQKTVFPASFQLICAMNPCPCGYFGESRCYCTPDKIKRYQSKISGPLLDRIDMQIRLNRPDQRLMFSKQREETSKTVKDRVELARKRQIKRQGKPNSELSVDKLDSYIQQNTELKELAIRTMERFEFSARAIHRSLRVALSIADLNQENLNTMHLSEALSYRQSIER